jgi:glycosyltransferase involved in cell wall biosynthesis
MYCGLCLRDNALVRELRGLGHQVLMVPLYLPLTLDEEDQSAGTPVFFSGINVYLEQQSAFFRAAPRWLHQLFTWRPLLKWASGRAAKTQPAGLGEMTISMLRGEEGNQARELDELIGWLKTQPKPDVLCLSTALLVGMARRLKAELGAPVVCGLQGEDSFLDGLPESHRSACGSALSHQAANVDTFISPSRYFGDLMARRLSLPAERMRVVPNGIGLDGYDTLSGDGSPKQPVLCYFGRMCKEKGLDTLVEAYMEVRRRNRVDHLRLRVAGSCGPSDEPLVKSLRARLAGAGLNGEVEFHPNVDHATKLQLLGSSTVFSVPALYGEAFGLYVLEAMAAGLPVVQPRTGAFPELIEATGGGVLCEPGSVAALAEAIEQLVLKPQDARALGEAGRRGTFEKFSAKAMAQGMLEVFRGLPAKDAKNAKGN